MLQWLADCEDELINRRHICAVLLHLIREYGPVTKVKAHVWMQVGHWLARGRADFNFPREVAVARLRLDAAMKIHYLATGDSEDLLDFVENNNELLRNFGDTRLLSRCLQVSKGSLSGLRGFQETSTLPSLNFRYVS